MIEFAVEGILFEEMEAAAAADTVQPRVILPSMTIDAANTKKPYSDATQVGMRDHKRAAARLGQTARYNSHLAHRAQSDRVDTSRALHRIRARRVRSKGRKSTSFTCAMGIDALSDLE